MGGACSTYGKRTGVCRVLVEKPRGKNHLEDPGIDAKIMLRWIFRKWNGRAWADWSGSDWGQLAGFCNAVMNFQVP
jgi:hypothetical protein